MKLYVVQHAKAHSQEIDPECSLTGKGKQDTKKVVAFIKTLNICVDSLWHSGKKRAAQTAGLLANGIKIEKGILTHNGLRPNDEALDMAKELVSIDKDIMIVSHMPFLGKLTSLLLTGSESAGAVAFKNSGVVCLQRNEDDRWQIDWMVTPELFA